MSYQIQFTPRADNQLAEVWTSAANRNAVTAALAEAERELRANPYDVGESRLTELVRVSFHKVFGLEVLVVEDDKRVTVYGVFPIRQTSK